MLEHLPDGARTRGVGQHRGAEDGDEDRGGGERNRGATDRAHEPVSGIMAAHVAEQGIGQRAVHEDFREDGLSITKELSSPKPPVRAAMSVIWTRGNDWSSNCRLTRDMARERRKAGERRSIRWNQAPPAPAMACPMLISLPLGSAMRKSRMPYGLSPMGTTIVTPASTRATW